VPHTTQIDEAPTHSVLISRPMARAAAAAAVYGIAWGGIARLWMRHISEDPSFTVSGTAFIVAAPTVISLLSVLAVRSLRWKRSARVPARLLAGLSTLSLGVAAGALMMPTLAAGGVVVAHRRRLPWIATAVIAALGCLPVILVIQEIPEKRLATALPWYVVLVASFVPVYARIYGPRNRLPLESKTASATPKQTPIPTPKGTPQPRV
jgi:hypothetical protein